MRKAKFLIISSLMLIPIFSFSQILDTTKMWGTWVGQNVEFLSPMKDSVNFLRNIKNSTLILEPLDKITVKIKRDSTIKTYSSSYSVNPGEKTFTNNGINSKILKLTDEELVLKVEGKDSYITYFKKASVQH